MRHSANQALGTRAGGLHRRRLLADRLATWLIGLGGLSVVLAILLIFVFVGRVALPLFQGSQLGREQSVSAASGTPMVSGTDSYQDLVWSLDSTGVLHVVDAVRGGSQDLPLPLDSLERVVCVAQEGGLRTDHLAVGTDRGRVVLASVRTWRILEAATPFSQAELELEDPLAALDSLLEEIPGPVEGLAFARGESAGLLAWHGKGRLQVAVEDREMGQWSLPVLPEGVDESPVALAAAPNGERLALATGSGQLLLLQVEDGALSLVARQPLGLSASPTALAFLVGSKRLVAGDATGHLASLVEVQGEAGSRWIAAPLLAAHAAPVTRLVAGPRDRTLLSADAGGGVKLHYATTGRTLVEKSLPGRHFAFSPRGDALVVAGRDSLRRVELRNAHPEISWRALFGSLQYEGYAAPGAVWQSTGGSDDFEPKFSLLPLIFGTLKGTLFALLISVPLALLGAIYISQFAPTWLARTVKPAIEIMAALPSVIIGFLAGLVFAPWLEEKLTLVLSFVVILPLLILFMVPVWQRMPGHKLGPKGLPQLAQGLVLTLIAFLLAWLVAPLLDARLFGGSLIQWLQERAGVVYDQRNSLVVGFALGFAVIPIIFTMAEDALGNVPEALVNASLALGASRWTTVYRVVLPAAAAGVFAAVMIGLGRAIGETMIVLMATGNTPLLDPSPFNGFRAMSACIAVEISEAPLGGTLYRVLFFTALLLFLFTFAINSVAAFIGESLRKRHGRL